MLIALSLYATQKLPSIKQPLLSRRGHLRHPVGPRITIFTAPGPFSGSAGDRQRVAIRSWLGLSPRITVVMFSQDASAVSFASSFDSRLIVDADVDFTFLGTPFFHSMMARSRSFGSDISVFVNPETILLPDFTSSMSFLHELDQDWLLVASPRNISYLPFRLSDDGTHWLKESDKRVKMKEEILSRKSQWSPSDGKLITAWNSRGSPLHTGTLPPFLYGKGTHNHWVISEALSSHLRFVFDASWTISSYFLDYPTNQSNDLSGRESWEYVGNSHLGALYGSSLFREANFSSLVRLMKCSGRYLFFDPVSYAVSRSGGRNKVGLLEKKILHSWRKKKVSACVETIKSSEGMWNWSSKNQLKASAKLDFPFLLESLLSGIADENKTIVLTVAGYSYKDMMMSWVCRMRHLKITNFIICALDRETYDFAILQGLPVFRDSSAPRDISFDNCHFGSKCFQRVTKAKSRIVLKILKLGYNVLLSDVDVYWFKNPVPLLSSFGPSVLAAQSDEYNKTGPINMPRRLNSGFYFVFSDGSTVAAMEKVVKHAATSGLSEQPSFYDMLCGEGGSNRVGDNMCKEPETNLTIYFLDRDLFPNGAYEGLWEKRNVREACSKMGCLVIHNNWISGRRKKLERQVLSGLWEYDISTRMCKQSSKISC
ncbi:hypothetical protein CDL15_Pgr024424 [Punica granatum]|uniref:Nucleotide-diphospho-sugar transferase domain-containing protein n=1 Tax=Punica granatum TaxID=22663 RepID=A0A218XYF7_PUNGR|nr:hypothetical protein CDL15_Pgr024424 [Punica granatum]